MDKSSVFVVDEDDASREALISLLRSQDVRARGFPNAIDFLASPPEDEMACVITGSRTSAMSGADFIREIRELREAWPVIVVTGDATVPIVVELMKSGAVDIIEKPFTSARLFEVLLHCFDAIELRAVEHQTRHEVADRLSSLTRRERQVFDLIVQGQSSKEIASSLNISPRTVAIFRSGLMKKMQASRVSVLVNMAVSIGVTKPGPDASEVVVPL
jgi:two-component system, LuxR family, response regulator FixJ